LILKYIMWTNSLNSNNLATDHASSEKTLFCDKRLYTHNKIALFSNLSKSFFSEGTAFLGSRFFGNSFQSFPPLFHICRWLMNHFSTTPTNLPALVFYLRSNFRTCFLLSFKLIHAFPNMVVCFIVYVMFLINMFT
jgi:hypothetical protein